MFSPPHRHNQVTLLLCLALFHRLQTLHARCATARAARRAAERRWAEALAQQGRLAAGADALVRKKRPEEGLRVPVPASNRVKVPFLGGRSDSGPGISVVSPPGLWNRFLPPSTWNIFPL